jgi:hypothetical protein
MTLVERLGLKTRIETLNLGNSRLEANRLHILLNLRRLKKLSLWNCKVDPAEVARLLDEVNTTLEELNIRIRAEEQQEEFHHAIADNRSIGDAGAQAIANAMLSINSLTMLLLDGCGIGNAAAIALAEMIKKNNTIKSLCLLTMTKLQSVANKRWWMQWLLI